MGGRTFPPHTSPPERTHSGRRRTTVGGCGRENEGFQGMLWGERDVQERDGETRMSSLLWTLFPNKVEEKFPAALDACPSWAPPPVLVPQPRICDARLCMCALLRPFTTCGPRICRMSFVPCRSSLSVVIYYNKVSLSRARARALSLSLCLPMMPMRDRGRRTNLLYNLLFNPRYPSHCTLSCRPALSHAGPFLVHANGIHTYI